MLADRRGRARHACHAHARQQWTQQALTEMVLIAYQKPLHDSSMYSKVEVNLNCAAVLPVRFSFLAAFAKLAMTCEVGFTL